MKEVLEHVWRSRTHIDRKPDPDDEDDEYGADYWWGDRVAYSDIDTGNPDLLVEVGRLHREWNDWELVDEALRRPPKDPRSPTGWLLKALRSLPDDPNDNANASRLIEERLRIAERQQLHAEARKLVVWVGQGGLNGKTWAEKMEEVKDREPWEQALQTCVQLKWLHEDGLLNYLGGMMFKRLVDEGSVTVTGDRP